MPTTLTDYRNKIRPLIRDVAGNGLTPNPALYILQDYEIDIFTESAVNLYTQYKSRKKPYTLQLVSGQSQYTLPSDWIMKDSESFCKAVEPPNISDDVFHQFSGFVLSSLNPAASFGSMVFDWYDSDQYVIISPTPQVAGSISFKYHISHVIDESSSSIPKSDMNYVVYCASSLALQSIAVDKGQKLQKYKIGQGLQIDNSEVAVRMQEQAKAFWCQFEDNIIYRPFGVMG